MATTKPISSFFLPKAEKKENHGFKMTLSELGAVQNSKRQRRNNKKSSSNDEPPSEPPVDREQQVKNDENMQPDGENTSMERASKPAKMVVVNEEGQRIVQKESKAVDAGDLEAPSVEQQHALSKKRSIVHQLIARSIAPGTKIRRHQTQSNAATSTGTSMSPAWSPCSWLVLMAASATAMAFDPEGILLAVATPIDKKVLIYDWDTVVASDFKGRMDLQKDAIQPMLEFRVPNTVSELQWDTNDNLLIAYRGTPALQVYDMAILADGVSTPRAALTKLQSAPHVVKYQGPRCVSFLPDNEHVVACYPCGAISLWNISSLPTSLVWTYKAAEPISKMLPISNNLLLLGGTEGGFLLLDWRKTKRAAFASDKTPTVVATWKTHTLMAKQAQQALPSARDLGVQTLSMDIPASTRNVDLIGTCRVHWITSGGWCLSMDLGRRKRIRVHHRPPEMKTLTSEGVRVPPSSSSKRFSSPSTPVLTASCAAGTSGILWQAVPQTTHVLPHQDKRVCQQREVRRSKEMRLCWVGGSASFSTVSYVSPKRVPTSLTVHPGKEWMIVATESRLMIYNARVQSVKNDSATCSATS
jgi:hypothetical protein